MTSPERRPRCRVQVARGTATTAKGRIDDLGEFAEGESGVTRIPQGLTDITAHVLQVQTVKALGTPAGTFQLALTFRTLDDLRRAALHKLLVPDNLLLIDLDRGTGTGLRRVMEGWISSIATQTSLARNGALQRRIIVTGHDAGKFLVRHELPGHLLTAFIQGSDEEARRLAEGLIIAGSVGEVERRLFQDLFVKLTPAPRAVQRFVSMLTHPALEPTSAKFPADALVSYIRATSVWSRHGKFWNILRQYLDAPWNEAWTDYLDTEAVRGQYADYSLAQAPATTAATSRPAGETTAAAPSATGDVQVMPEVTVTAERTPRRSGFHIVIRPQPFQPNDWRSLPLTTVYDADLKMESLRLADDERVNLTYVAPQGNVQAHMDEYLQAIMFNTFFFDRDSAERHGTQVLQASTMYSDIEGTAHTDPAELQQATAGHGDLYDALQTRSRRLYDWYSPNDRFWKGVLVVKGDPALKIGQRVGNQREPSDSFTTSDFVRREFYVEKVIHNYVEGQTFETHLGVTRGQPLGRPLAIVEPNQVSR